LDFEKKAGNYPNFESGGYVEIGVPHYVIFVNDVETVDVQKLGSEISHHPTFSKGTNVDFVQIHHSRSLSLRTFERGVEAETLSCGTGATASAIIASQLKGVKSPTEVKVPGGNLTISFDEEFKTIWLSGTVDEVYQGILI